MTAFWGSRASEFIGGVTAMAGVGPSTPPQRPMPVQAPQCDSSPETVVESDSHRRSRSRDFFGHFGLGKGVQREEEDHVMDVDEPEGEFDQRGKVTDELTVQHPYRSSFLNPSPLATSLPRFKYPKVASTFRRHSTPAKQSPPSSLSNSTGTRASATRSIRH